MPRLPGRYRPLVTRAPVAGRERLSPAARGYGHRWRVVSKRFLDENPLCAECSTEERPVAAEVVDHVIPHKGDMALFWDPDNWRGLCARCHNRKTAREDGGFGRPVKHGG